jgi:hypothetical protein
VIVARSLLVAITERDAAVRRDPIAARTAIIAGVIFIFAGLVKFVFHRLAAMVLLLTRARY